MGEVNGAFHSGNYEGAHGFHAYNDVPPLIGAGAPTPWAVDFFNSEREGARRTADCRLKPTHCETFLMKKEQPWPLVVL